MNRWMTRLNDLGQSTFVLTPGERKALWLVLVLALLGLGVKCGHSYQERPPSTTLHK